MGWKYRRWRLKQHWTTLGDIDARDKLLWYITRFLHQKGFTANCMTSLGFFFLGTWILLFDILQVRNYWADSTFATIIGLTDFLDGPTARNNNNISAEGTVADYMRDLFYVCYLCRVAFEYGMPLPLVSVVIAFEIIAVCIKLCKVYRHVPKPYCWQKISEFCIDNFQGELSDRLQFTVFCFGASLFFTAGYFGNTWWFHIAQALGWISIGIGIPVLIKEWKWKPETLEENK